MWYTDAPYEIIVIDNGSTDGNICIPWVEPFAVISIPRTEGSQVP